MLKHEFLPVINVHDLEKAIKEEYNEDVEVSNLFWEGDYINDCYKALHFAAITGEAGPYKVEPDEKNAEIQNKIYELLFKIFPNYRSVLVDVSW